MTVVVGVVARISVEGRPAPKGSRQHFRSGGSKEMSVHLPAWRAALSTEIDAWCLRHCDRQILDGPIVAEFTFYLDRPKRAKDRTYPGVLPDLDKLCRAVGDELSDKIYTDDARIVELHAFKNYATDERPPGVDIRIGELTGTAR